jgi:RimJ/RimL family protein N-acetyltransferase
MRHLPEVEAVMLTRIPHMPIWKQYLPFGHGGTPSALRTRKVHDTWRLRDGTMVTLRAARADDGPLMQDLMHGLSMQSRYMRFLHPLHELTPDLLVRFTQSDPMAALSLLAVVQQDGRDVAIAMAQYVTEPYPERCDFAVLVADEWQHDGIGTRLIQALICIARAAGIERIEGDILAENEPMRRLMLRMDFTLTQNDEDVHLRKASKRLSTPEWNCSPLTVLGTQAKAYA